MFINQPIGWSLHIDFAVVGMCVGFELNAMVCILFVMFFTILSSVSGDFDQAWQEAL